MPWVILFVVLIAMMIAALGHGDQKEAGFPFVHSAQVWRRTNACWQGHFACLNGHIAIRKPCDCSGAYGDSRSLGTWRGLLPQSPSSSSFSPGWRRTAEASMVDGLRPFVDLTHCGPPRGE